MYGLLIIVDTDINCAAVRREGQKLWRTSLRWNSRGHMVGGSIYYGDDLSVPVGDVSLSTIRGHSDERGSFSDGNGAIDNGLCDFRAGCRRRGWHWLGCSGRA